MNDVETDEWRTRRLDKNELAEFLHTNVCAELLPTRFSDRNSFFLVALCMFHSLKNNNPIKNCDSRMGW